ncbi:MAG: hypothetical protein ABSD29_03725 [Verrucomicrobiota bacterium]|jgi:hypothetical protein
MKLPSLHASRITPYVSLPRRRQAGSAVIVVMALLAIILVYLAANLRTLDSLGRELKLLERQQTRRLQTATATTNSPSATTVGTNSVPKSPPN